MAHKAKRSAKQIAAATKSILSWEKKQAKMNRISDNPEMFVMGVVAGACLLFLVWVFRNL